MIKNRGSMDVKSSRKVIHSDPVQIGDDQLFNLVGEQATLDLLSGSLIDLRWA